MNYPNARNNMLKIQGQTDTIQLLKNEFTRNTLQVRALSVDQTSVFNKKNSANMI